MAATPVVQSPLQWLQAATPNCVSRSAGSSKSRTMVRSFGKVAADGGLCTSGWRRLRAGAGLKSRRTRLACTPGEEKQEVVSSKTRDLAKETVKPAEKSKGVVEKIEEEMGRQFGGVLWFTVLIVCLAVFGGAYVYYIITFANFDDIPILRGPVR